MKDDKESRIRRAAACLSPVAFAVMTPARCMAENDPDPDISNIGNRLKYYAGHDEVGKVAKKFLGIFRSGYDLVITIGLALIVIALIWAAIKLAVSGGGNEREKAKGDILRFLLGGVGLGAVLIVISLVLSLGKAFR